MDVGKVVGVDVGEVVAVFMTAEVGLVCAHTNTYTETYTHAQKHTHTHIHTHRQTVFHLFSARWCLRCPNHTQQKTSHFSHNSWVHTDTHTEPMCGINHTARAAMQTDEWGQKATATGH